jgi:16S rRNA processing protein RimM
MNYIEVGVIVNTHGLKGTVKVKAFTDFVEERFKKGQTLYISHKNEYIPVVVTNMKQVKNVLHVDFENLNNINLVEKYKQSKLVIKESDIHKLNENDYYIKDLIGLEVYTDELIGTVIDVYDMPRDDILVVKRKQDKNALIPLRNQFISSIDFKQNKIEIINWEGLL